MIYQIIRSSFFRIEIPPIELSIDFLINYSNLTIQEWLLDPTQNLLSHLWIWQSWLVAMSSCTASSSTSPLTRYKLWYYWIRLSLPCRRRARFIEMEIENSFSNIDEFTFIQVAWIYMERSAILTVQNHVITRNPRISVSHDQHHTWSLHITSVQESDRGGYM